MGKEIERKFLVKKQLWKRTSASRSYFEHCVQGYLSDNSRGVVRVRQMGSKGFITVKGRADGMSRSEYEYEIPLQDAQEIIDSMCTKLVRKNRYTGRYPDEWIVDDYIGENTGLIVAEIELKSPSQKFKRPVWVGKEVTEDPRYSNSNLAKHPYRQWGKK